MKTSTYMIILPIIYGISDHHPNGEFLKIWTDVDCDDTSNVNDSTFKKGVSFRRITQSKTLLS
jgi:hypothetical protein